MSLAPAIDWAAVELALTAWVTYVTGFPVNSKIVFEKQDATYKPVYPYISLSRSGPKKEKGIDDIIRQEVTVADESFVDNIVEGPRLFTVSIKAHCQRTDPVNQDAVSVLSTMQASLGLEAVNGILKTAGLAVVREMDVTDISEPLNGRWVSRANLDVVFRVASQVKERVERIESVEVEIETDTADFTFTVDGSES